VKKLKETWTTVFVSLFLPNFCHYCVHDFFFSKWRAPKLLQWFEKSSKIWHKKEEKAKALENLT